jgi:hypothetical protein
LEIVERVSSFAYPVVVQSSHTFGRLLDRGCKCVGVNKIHGKKSLNKQIQMNASAASNNNDVGYLGDSNVVSDGNREQPTGANASYSQNNQAEDHVASLEYIMGVISTVVVSQLWMYVET